MPPSNTGNGFADAIHQAQQRPEPGGGVGRDLPDGFPFSPGGGQHQVVESPEEGIVGAVQYDYKAHRKVYTIYRPWKACERCCNQIAQDKNEDLLEDPGDFECTHTQLEAYQTVMNDILAGKLVKVSEREVDLRDGTIVVSLHWLEPKENHKARRQAMKDARAAQRG